MRSRIRVNVAEKHDSESLDELEPRGSDKEANMNLKRGWPE
jgi:hypothetical protein